MLRTLLLCAALISTARAATILVSPDGPIDSLQAARDAVRQHPARGKEPLEVVFAAGDYPLAAPVIFEPQDSGTAAAPVTYRAAAGAEVIIHGGQRITGWQVENGRWKTQLPPGTKFEALWVAGQRAQRARTPNGPGFQAVQAPNAPLPGIPLPGPLERCAIQCEPADLEPLAGLDPAALREVNAVVYHSWQTTRHRIAGADLQSGTLQFTGQSPYSFFGFEPYHRVYFENLPAALDQPGEWLLEPSGTLRYIPRPGETPEATPVVAPVAPQWLIFRGSGKDGPMVEHLRFNGLRFRFQKYELPAEGYAHKQADASLGAAIEADWARGIVLENCELAHTGTHAVWFRRQCRDNAVLSSHLHDLAGGAVKIGEEKLRPEPERTAFTRIENNILHTGGRYFHGSVGVWIGESTDNQILHNDIADFFYTGVSVGWTWGYTEAGAARNHIDWNRIHHLGWGHLSDLAAVYTLGFSPGSTMRHNRVHDIDSYSYGGWGLYNDEGSEGWLLENNLVYRTKSGGYHQHYGRNNTVRNNIFALSREMQIRRSKREAFMPFRFEQNIVLWRDGLLFGQMDANWDDGLPQLSKNLYWRIGAAPENFAGKTWDQWREKGYDAGSIIADPLFVDPDRDDFRLRDTTAIERIGFVPFDWEKAGVQGSDAWRKLAAREFPPMKFAELKIRRSPKHIINDFEHAQPGEKPRGARVVEGSAACTVRVETGIAASGKNALAVQDDPAAQPSYNPHFYFHPAHTTGRSRVAYTLRAEPGVRLLHEWRNTDGNAALRYRSGPMLDLADNAFSVNRRKLADYTPNTWVRVEIQAAVGEKCDRTFTLTLTPQGGQPQRFDGLKFEHDDATENLWIGFISHGKTHTKWWLDDLEIVPLP